MRVATLIVLMCAFLRAQTAALEGVVINTATGQPMSGVHFRIFSGSFNGIDTVYGAMSDQAGRFSVASLPAGSYFLWPESAGFVCVQENSGSTQFPTITLMPGQRLNDFKLLMSPRAAILGRVVDEYGDPVPNVSIQAIPVSKNAPPAFSLQQGRSWTDDRGEFRLSGGPGKFYIKASPGSGNAAAETRTDGSVPSVYGPTFYPSASLQERASVVEAVAGRDITGIEIRLNPQKVLTITGVVLGMPEGGGRPMVGLRSGDGFTEYRTAMVEANGRFSFASLPPGNYKVWASYPSDSPRMRSPETEVRPDASGALNLELTLRGGIEVTGSLEIDGELQAIRTVHLKPSGNAGFDLPATHCQSDKDGAFRFPPVLLGRYTVTVAPLPENGYIQAVQVDGAAAPDGIVDLSRAAAASKLRIVVNRNGGRLSGKILDPDGAQITSGMAMVLLIARPEDADNEHLTRATDGAYSIQGIAPGKYRILVLDAFRSGPLNNADAVKALFNVAEEIEIKGGDRLTKDLKVITKGDARATPKQ